MDREGAAPLAGTPGVPRPGSVTQTSAPAPCSSAPGAATNLDYSPAPDEAAEAEEVDPEARSAMESLAKVVTNTTSTSESDNLSEGSEFHKEHEVREVRMLREMMEVAETFTRSVTHFCDASHNEEAKMDKAKPTS